MPRSPEPLAPANGVEAVLDALMAARWICRGYLANLCLAAQSLGIATIVQAAIAGCAEFVREHFQIPPNRQILCGVSFGYPDPQHPANRFRTPRAGLDEVVTFAT